MRKWVKCYEKNFGGYFSFSSFFWRMQRFQGLPVSETCKRGVWNYFFRGEEEFWMGNGNGSDERADRAIL